MSRDKLSFKYFSLELCIKLIYFSTSQFCEMLILWDKEMNKQDFEDYLKKASINKKEFAELTELPYQTIMNWNNSDNAPKWVKSWLENYIKAKDMDKVVEAVKPHIK